MKGRKRSLNLQIQQNRIRKIQNQIKIPTVKKLASPTSIKESSPHLSYCYSKKLLEIEQQPKNLLWKDNLPFGPGSNLER